MSFSNRWSDCPIQENKRWLIDHLSPSRTAMQKKTRTHETSIRTHRKPKKGGKKAFSNNSTTDLRYIRLSRLYKVLCFFYALRGLVGYYLNLANGLKGNYVNEKVFVVKYAINRQHFQ